MHGQTVSSGVALREQDKCLHFVELGSGWIGVTCFVLGLLSFVLLANGVLQVILALVGAGGYLVAGSIMTALGALVGYGAVRCWKLKSQREHLPTSALHVLATLDLAAGVLRGGAGQVLAPLGEVRFETRFQLTSSSRRLVVRWGSGELDLVKGDPFAGGLWAITQELSRRGFTVC